jgi:hypothetical protein
VVGVRDIDFGMLGELETKVGLFGHGIKQDPVSATRHRAQALGLCLEVAIPL